jgi:hypothetical protein
VLFSLSPYKLVYALHCPLCIIWLRSNELSLVCQETDENSISTDWVSTASRARNSRRHQGLRFAFNEVLWLNMLALAAGSPSTRT